MRKQLLSIIVCCATGLALGMQAQESSSSGSSSDPNSSSSGSQSGSQSGSSTLGGSSGSQSGWTGRHYGAGHMGHQAVRVSQLMGAQVTGSSGSQIGTISDCIVNPMSGRIDFAVLSLSPGAVGGGTSTEGTSSGTSSSGAATSPGSSSTGSSTSPGSSSSSGGSSSSSLGGTSSSTASSSGKQVAVPWMLLRPSQSASSTSTSMQQPSFVFSGSASKLESAPTFDANTDLNQPSWRQSVFSYFGLSGAGSATGGAESPSGSSSSESSGSSSGSSGSSSQPQQQPQQQ